MELGLNVNKTSDVAYFDVNEYILAIRFPILGFVQLDEFILNLQVHTVCDCGYTCV